MKNYLFILILCLSLPGHAQEYSAIKGFVKGAKLKEVTLYKTARCSIQGVCDLLNLERTAVSGFC